MPFLLAFFFTGTLFALSCASLKGDALRRGPCGKEASGQQPNREMNSANNHVSELGSGSFHGKLLE